jgi:hypothetical protein
VDALLAQPAYCPHEELLLLQRAAELRTSWRASRGSVDILLPEAKVEVPEGDLDKSKPGVTITSLPDSPARRLVQEMMVLAGGWASVLQRSGQPGVQPETDPSLSLLSRAALSSRSSKPLAATGRQPGGIRPLQLPLSTLPPPSHPLPLPLIARALSSPSPPPPPPRPTGEAVGKLGEQHGIPLPYRGQEAPTLPDPATLATLPTVEARAFALKRRMTRSTCTSSALPHASLGLQAYVQFTSPIRRCVCHPCPVPGASAAAQ